MMRNPIPISLRLEEPTEKTLGNLADKANLKKATLAQLIISAGVDALSAKPALMLPIRFKVDTKAEA